MRIQGVIPVLSPFQTSPNVLAGSAFQVLARPARLKFYITVGGIGGFSVVAKIQIGSRVVLEFSRCAALSRFPLIPDDLIASAHADGGSVLSLVFRDVFGFASSPKWIVDIAED